MSVLFGHPTGGPFSHNAALAYFEAGRLESFCVPWMPSPRTLRILRIIPPLREWAGRLERRCFLPLLEAPRTEGRLGEWQRLIKRICFKNTDSEALAYEANDWLMETMTRECRRSSVTAVHSYEDCSMLQFQEAKRLGKKCIYDLPIGYYPAWERTSDELNRHFADWLPPRAIPARRHVRPDQKRREMELADVVFVPSTFVERTVRQFLPDKKIALTPYGVDAEFWRPGPERSADGKLRFIYAGQISVRKGIPLLLEAWHKAAPSSATLDLVGPWQLNENRRLNLPPNVCHWPACSAEQLRARYQSADVFVFPSYFEGFGLVLLEAMACGLPVIGTEATAAPDIIDSTNGTVITTGDIESLIHALRSIADNRDELPRLKRGAREKAKHCSWEAYRKSVIQGTDQ